MSLATFTEDPAAKLDFVVDWSAWLGADTIASSTWVVTPGLTSSSLSNTTTTATIWLTGFVAGQSYVAKNHVVTAAGRADSRSISIEGVDR
jgi:hypothetical protein